MTEVAIANVEMAAAWDGEEGDDWTENAERYDATGLDLARRQSADEGLTNVRYVQGDAQVHSFEPESFDIIISSFGAMFFVDPVAAFVNIGRALRGDGRIALLAWQRFEDNEWLTEIFGAVAAGRDLPAPQPGAPGPFGLAEPDAVRRMLGDAGFGHEAITPVIEPIWQGTDEGDAWSFLSTMGIVRGLTDGLDPEARQQAFDNLRRSIAAHATDDGVVFRSAAWLITARKP
jgi:SAM-dependent methyltransferase